jgi:ParB family chromosome partitioning protein
VAQHRTELKLPADFAKKIAETLNWKLEVVEDLLEFSEDKEGFFWAILRPKKNFDKPDFIAVCRLTRDLGGEDYLKGAKAWKVPGPMAKKGPTDPQEKPSGHGTDSQATYKDTGNAIPSIPNVKFIPVDAVKIPTFLPTRALISNERLTEIRQSIKKHGLKYPIKVRPGPDPNTYELIDGYLRLKSVQQLDWKEVPAEITPASDQEVVIDSIVTNKDRIEEDPITVAKKLDILVNAFGWTQEKVADEVGIDRTSVSNYIRLLRLPKEVQHCFAVNNVTFHHGLLLLQVEDPELQVQLANEVVSNALSTRQLEERIHEVQPKPESPEIPEKHEENKEERPPGESRTPEKQISCARCGEPIEGTSVHLGEGKYYDAECAEQVVAEAKGKNVIPEAHVGPFEEKHVLEPEVQSGSTERKSEQAEKEVLKAVPIGEFDCTECHKHFLIEHLPNGEHKLTFVRSVEG